MPKFNEAQREWVNTFLGRGVGGGMMSIVQREGAKAFAPRPIPGLADVTKQREENAAPKPAPDADPGDSMPATKFERSKSAVGDDDGRLSGDVEYAKLKDDLQKVLSQQFWSGLESRQRRTLVETYRRMTAYGVWDQVKQVTGEKEKPEAHFKILNWEFEVDGNSGGLTYEAYAADALVKKLIGTGHFGKDGDLIGREHKGKISLREWRDNEPNVPTSLHISVGPGNTFDAHIDKVSPVNQPVGGKTQIDPFRGAKHRLTEVESEKIYKKTGVPVTFEVSNEENSEGKQETKIGVKLEVRGPVDKKKPQLGNKSVAPNPAPQDAQERIIKRVERTKGYFKIPIGTRPEEVPEPKMIATKMSALMLDAGKNRKNTIVMDVNFYENATVDQPSALAMMREIGQIVRSELGPQVESVTRLTVTFGTFQQQGTVSIAD